MGLSTRERVQRHRDGLRALGLKPVQIWVPDTSRAGFRDECQRQSALTLNADARDSGLDAFMDEALSDIGEDE